MISDRALDGLAELMEERLEMLGERFQRLNIRSLTGASFAAYVRAPDRFETILSYLIAGWGARVEPLASGGTRWAFRPSRTQQGRMGFGARIRAGWMAFRAA
jgi:hypothetical protein